MEEEPRERGGASGEWRDFQKEKKLQETGGVSGKEEEPQEREGALGETRDFQKEEELQGKG